MDPSKRFVTIVLAVGVLVLLAAIAIGQRMGTRVLVQATNSGNLDSTPIVTPLPAQTPVNYGPNWKREQTLSGAVDPAFPDPRIPPKPLPTLEPTPTPNPQKTPKWTPNPNIPIWDQTPPSSGSPSPSPSAVTPSLSPPQASVSPGESPGTKATPTPLP
jgi:hypothetical protein